MKTEVAVVGSSPLMLLVALDAVRQGASATVFDGVGTWGGAWRTVPVAGLDEVEFACHLIEDVAEVYSTLEAASGERFQVLKPAPVRVLPNGVRLPYTSRWVLSAGAAWSIAMLARYACRCVIGLTSPAEDERATIFRQKIADLARYQGSRLVRGTRIQAPVRGYAAFIGALLSRCKEAGVRFQPVEVREAYREGGGAWRIVSGANERFRVDRIWTTSSSSLIPDGSERFRSMTRPEIETASLLVEVTPDGLCDPVSYAAFWRDPDVTRISRLDRSELPGRATFFLLQLRHASLERTRWESVVHNAFSRAGIIREEGSARVVDRVSCLRVPQQHQLPAGEIAPGFLSLRSTGNLASGVSRWTDRSQRTSFL